MNGGKPLVVAQLSPDVLTCPITDPSPPVFRIARDVPRCTLRYMPCLLRFVLLASHRHCVGRRERSYTSRKKNVQQRKRYFRPLSTAQARLFLFSVVQTIPTSSTRCRSASDMATFALSYLSNTALSRSSVSFLASAVFWCLSASYEEGKI